MNTEGTDMSVRMLSVCQEPPCSTLHMLHQERNHAHISAGVNTCEKLNMKVLTSTKLVALVDKEAQGQTKARLKAESSEVGLSP